MSILIVILLSVFINPSQSDIFWDATVQTVMNMFKKEDILKLNLTTMCSWQVDVLYDHQDILFQMYDASAKFPYAGIVDSGRVELGNFDQCMSIDSTINDVRILGKYCYAGLILPDFTNISNIDAFYKLATCTPDLCTGNDIFTIANYVIPGIPSVIIDDFCTTKETGKEITFGTLFSVYLIFLILFLMFISTLYDIYCRKMGTKILHPLLLAFSVVTNTRSILKVSPKQSSEIIQIFSGFRIISMAWIIAGHAIQSFTNFVMPAMNTDETVSRIKMRYTSYLFGANFAVTTFFFMSGFLVSYLYLKRKILPWKDQLKSLPLLYLHRYIRLTTPIVFLYLLVLYVFQYAGSGPLWQPGCQGEINNCKKYWWSYFLYIQNYANWDQLCLIPLWYISADMQLFILAPLVLIPISIVLKSSSDFKLAMIILAGLNIFLLILNLGIRLIFPETTKNHFDTHGRLPEYFIGVMMGVFMRFTKEKPFLCNIKTKFVACINFITWIIVFSGMFTVFLFTEDAEMWFDTTNRSLYVAFTRVIWSIGLSWMVYSCYHGYGGIVNWILSRPLFQVGAKLTYSMYLLHYLVLGHYAFSNRMKFYIDDYVEFYLFCGYFVETLMWSFLWTLAFESPILTIEKYFFNNAGTNLNNKRSEEPTISNC